MHKSTLLRLVLIVLLLSPIISAWGQEGPLKIYFWGPAAMIQEIERNFEAYRGDVLLIVTPPPSMELELTSGSTSADIVWGGGLILHQQMSELEWLRTYRSSQLGSLARKFSQTANYAPITGVEELIIITNSQLVSDDEAPKQWEDLLSEAWRGQVAMPDPTRLTSTLMGTSALVKEHDWIFFETLHQKEVQLAAGYAEVADMVAAGDAHVGIARLEDALALIQAGMPLKVVWPTDGAIAIPKPIAIIDQKNRSRFMTGVAEQLVEFALSLQGQEIAREYGLLPSRADVPLPAAVPSDIRYLEPDTRWVVEHREELQARFSGIFGIR